MSVRSRPRRGFTLIELLVVIAIIAILVALLLPAVQAVREAARKSQCQDHLHNIVIALHNYENAIKVLPPGAGPLSPVGMGTAQPAWAWSAYLLPYIEQKPLFDSLMINQVNLNQAVTNTNLVTLMQSPIEVYRCPSDTAPQTMEGMKSKSGMNHDPTWVATNAPTTFYPATSNYLANCGHKVIGQANNTGPIFELSSVRLSEIKDGTGNVLFVGERDEECAAGTWVGSRNGGGSGPRGNNYMLGNVFQKPNLVYTGQDFWVGQGGGVNFVTCLYGFSSKHPGGTQFAMGDGKVTFISENIESDLYVCSNTFQTLCNQNQEAYYVRLGVYQRLGNMQDGLPVKVP